MLFDGKKIEFVLLEKLKGVDTKGWIFFAAAAVLAVSFPAVFTAVLFFLDFEIIGKIFSYFANNPVMFVLLILSAVISAVFVCAGPVKVKNAILGIKRKDKH